MTLTLSRRAALAGGAVLLAAPGLLGQARGARAQTPAAPPVLVYPRKVGALELTAISDGYFAMPRASSSTSPRRSSAQPSRPPSSIRPGRTRAGSPRTSSAAAAGRC
jgi:hypothetical protein